MQTKTQKITRKQNAEKDTKDHEKETPLHLASLKGDFEIV
jgi:hypothetical protein